MSWIQTFTGKKFTPFDPRPEDVEIEDIAHALSMLCRFGGHVKEFYSVADHSIRCSIVAPPAHKLYALLHDAAEAYLIDLPRPIKYSLPLYLEAEGKIALAIAERFNLPPIVPDIIHEIDNRMLMTEAAHLMKEPPEDWGITARPYGTWFAPARSQREAEREFLQLYTDYSMRSAV